MFTARRRPRLTWWLAGGVVAEQRVPAAGEFAVVGEIGFGFGGFHPVHGVARRDRLSQGNESPELDPAPQGGLPDE